MATHRLPHQRTASISDSLLRAGGKSESLMTVIDNLSIAGTAYATTSSAILPCHLYTAASFVVEVRSWTTGDVLKLRPELNWDDMQEVIVSRYNDSTWKANFANSSFFVPMERTQVSGGTPALVPVEIVMSQDSKITNAVVTILTRGARFLRLGYASGAGTAIVASVRVCLHTGSWVGWA